MGDSLEVDLNELRATAARQRDIADRAMLLAAELNSAVEGAGVAWGTDKPGKAFEEHYLPRSQEAQDALGRLADALDTMSGGLADSAVAFETADVAMGDMVGRSFSAWTDTAELPPVASPGRIPGPGTASTAPVPHHTISPAAASAGEQEVIPTTATPRGDAVRGGPVPSSQPPSGTSPQSPASRSASPGSAGAAGRPAATPADQVRPETRPAPTGDVSTGSTGVAGTSGRPAANTTGTQSGATSSGRSSGTPWSGVPASARGAPGTASPSAPRAPHDDQPPRSSAPRTTRPPTAPKTAEPGTRSPEKRPVAAPPKRASSPAVTIRAEIRTDPDVLRIVGEMAARHGLTLVGFDTAGVDEKAVRALAAAVDDVLTTHHIIDLRVIEIVDTRAEFAGIRWDRVVDGSADTARLVLDRARLNTPDPGSGDPASVSRIALQQSADPIYTAVVHALGRALDTLGGHSAHRRVQRALIEHFLHTVSPDYRRRTIGRVVADYRRWRDTLAGIGGSERFDPQSALIEAFVSVVGGTGREVDAVGVLHRLLVEAARPTG